MVFGVIFLEMLMATLLRHKGFIADPIRGFQLILPPEYRALGCMPAEYFIDGLMCFLHAPYYVGL